MLIKSIKLTNFLSFGEDSQELELRPLNVIIGPNGSGKSNLLEAIDLLRAAPGNLLAQIRDAGGVHDLLWKGTTKSSLAATIDAVLNYPAGHKNLHYNLIFTEMGQRFKIIGEFIEDAQPENMSDDAQNHYYGNVGGINLLNPKNGEKREVDYNDLDPTLSILAQRKDPDQYPEMTWLGNMFGKIRLYREWSFGRYTRQRLPQKTDLPNYFLEPDCSNLGLALNNFRLNPESKLKFLDALRALYDNIDDFGVCIEGGTVQVFLQEGRYNIPATRLSDGTLRYLCLLAILCHPNPPPLICIEEPELGLHPDVLPTLASLLIDASERTQLIVTTHSDVLVDALTEQPEAIVIAEKNESGTTLKRLDAEHLKPWLDKYRLGQLWTSGEIGGTRW